MSQPSVIQFFTSRKRPAVQEYNKLDKKRKLSQVDLKDSSSCNFHQEVQSLSLSQQGHTSVDQEHVNSANETSIPERNNLIATSTKQIKLNDISSKCKNKKVSELEHIKNVMNKSAKLKTLKASIDAFKKSADQLKLAEKRTADILLSPKLDTFKSIEINVSVSPQKKTQTPEKAYVLSPKRPTVRKLLFDATSPVKNVYATTNDQDLSSDGTDPAKGSLRLPFKYKTLYEFFRAIETITQILYNRKESVTFGKLKPAVEEMVKRNVLLKHLAQIKSIYPDAYQYAQKKGFANRFEHTQYELVLTPIIDSDVMSTQDIIKRRRKFYQILIDRVKNCHNDFLLSLTPSITISKDQITRWHPDFEIEKVPDIEPADLPQSPSLEKCTSGKEILENAQRLFSCNKRMNQVMLNMKQLNENKTPLETTIVNQKNSLLNNIPKALLEKVRQKQAAKALISMTRTFDNEKKVKLYSRLPELARLIRNLFVTEKKTVLELDVIIKKLENSYRTFLSKTEIEEHLKTISTEIPGWLIFHKLRQSVFLKLDKKADLSVVISKLENLALERSAL